MLIPKQSKYNKVFKGRCQKIKVLKGNKLQYGSFGIQAMESTRLNSKQLEMLRKDIMQVIKKKGKLWINVHPDVSISKKATGVRMGKGKGKFSHWVCRVNRGHVIYELDGLPKQIAIKALKKVSYKLPISTKIIQVKGSLL